MSFIDNLCEHRRLKGARLLLGEDTPAYKAQELKLKSLTFADTLSLRQDFFELNYRRSEADNAVDMIVKSFLYDRIERNTK